MTKQSTIKKLIDKLIEFIWRKCTISYITKERYCYYIFTLELVKTKIGTSGWEFYDSINVKLFHKVLFDFKYDWSSIVYKEDDGSCYD